MADVKKPAKKPAPVKFPSNWSKMSQKERLDWHEANMPKKPGAAQPARSPAVPVQPAQPTSGATTEDEYPPDEQDEDQPDEQDEECPEDEVHVTIKIAGEPVREMTGKDFVKRLLRGLCESLGEE